MEKQKLSKGPNQNRHKKQASLALTPEQEVALKAALVKAEEEKKAEAERLRLWEANLPKLSHQQLAGELRRMIRREHVKVGKGVYAPQAGFTIAYATLFETVLTNTKTKENPFAKLSCYLR